MRPPFDVVILGLSVTSSWGNGHATTYRSLVRGLASRNFRVLFLERDLPWYKGNRDEPRPRGAVTELYQSFDELVTNFEREVTEAEAVIVGSFVPEGARIGEWVTTMAKGTTAFYDIDTPVTLARLRDGDREHITPELIRRYGVYLSFTGGDVLRTLETRYGSPMARALYCSVDPQEYRPQPQPARWDLGYLGTYSEDRQPGLERHMLEPARLSAHRRFAVVGPMYPADISWPTNVDREIHLSPRQHPAFYGAQRFTLNLTRAAMKQAGFSPSVRLFEAGACGVPIISDWWPGFDSIFEIGREALISESTDDTLRWLRDVSETQRQSIGEAARRRILNEHTPQMRAIQLERYLKEAHDNLSSYPARRHGCERPHTGRLAAGLPSERARQAAGTGARRTLGENSDSSDLHEPAGTSDGDRERDRREAPIVATEQ